MKPFFFLSFVITLTLMLTACTNEAPKTDAEAAAQQGMTLEEYQEFKQKAAQMGMDAGEHGEMPDDEDED